MLDSGFLVPFNALGLHCSSSLLERATAGEPTGENDVREAPESFATGLAKTVGASGLSGSESSGASGS
jgi:hypothetical protein